VKATLEDVNIVFRPQQGFLWVFYDQNLKKLLPKRGNEYAPDPANSMNITRGFVIFFNNMAAFSNALYPAGATEPKLTYSMKPIFFAGYSSRHADHRRKDCRLHNSKECRAIVYVAWRMGRD